MHGRKRWKREERYTELKGKEWQTWISSVEERWLHLSICCVNPETLSSCTTIRRCFAIFPLLWEGVNFVPLRTPHRDWRITRTSSRWCSTAVAIEWHLKEFSESKIWLKYCPHVPWSKKVTPEENIWKSLGMNWLAEMNFLMRIWCSHDRSWCCKHVFFLSDLRHDVNMMRWQGMQLTKHEVDRGSEDYCMGTNDLLARITNDKCTQKVVNY